MQYKEMTHAKHTVRAKPYLNIKQGKTLDNLVNTVCLCPNVLKEGRYDPSVVLVRQPTTPVDEAVTGNADLRTTTSY